jgi:hypothetical protein
MAYLNSDRPSEIIAEVKDFLSSLAQIESFKTYNFDKGIVEPSVNCDFTLGDEKYNLFFFVSLRGDYIWRYCEGKGNYDKECIRYDDKEAQQVFDSILSRGWIKKSV